MRPRKAVKCLNTGKIYESPQAAQQLTGANNKSIIQCCNGKRNYAGKLDGTKLVWTYVTNDIVTNDVTIKLKAENEKLKAEIEKLKIKNKKLKTIIDTLVED